jgi:hypothetical protein
MATIIDTRDFECSEDTLMSIAEFVGPFIDGGGVEIIVKIRKTDEHRQRKMTARDVLQQMFDGRETSYREYCYNFDFYLHKYYWHDKAIHITQSEALFLYRWLMLDQCDHSQMYFIHNIRKRYGREFLREADHA